MYAHVAEDAALRVVVLEDEALFLELLEIALARYADIDIVGTFSDGPGCLAGVAGLAPDVALLDIELVHGGMNGIEVGLRLRERHPDLGIVLLSNHRDPSFIEPFRQSNLTGWSYLLKKSVANVEALRRAIVGAADGFVVLDPQLMAETAPRGQTRLAKLTPRQREILELMAQGHTNGSIAERLVVSVKTVENHINSLYQELGVDRGGAFQPRVLAVLEYLRGIQAL